MPDPPGEGNEVRPNEAAWEMIQRADEQASKRTEHIEDKLPYNNIRIPSTSYRFIIITRGEPPL